MWHVDYCSLWDVYAFLIYRLRFYATLFPSVTYDIFLYVWNCFKNGILFNTIINSNIRHIQNLIFQTQKSNDNKYKCKKKCSALLMKNFQIHDNNKWEVIYPP